MRTYLLSVFFVLSFLCAHVTPEVVQAEADVEPRVFFVEPEDGATVSSPVHIKMGVSGMAVSKAGELKPHTGHHHLIIDGAGVAEGSIVPADARHIHFGAGQTETDVSLPSGTHTLTLQFADGAHGSYGDKLSTTITIHVK